MNRNELIKKTIRKDGGRNGGYTYHTYQTKYDGLGDFKLFHYGTKILQVDTDQQDVTGYYCCSRSDQEMLSIAIWELDTKGIINGKRYRVSHKRMKEKVVDGLYIELGKYVDFLKKFNKLDDDKKDKLIDRLKQSKKQEDHIQSFLDRGYTNTINEIDDHLEQSKRVTNARDKYWSAYRNADGIEKAGDYYILSNTYFYDPKKDQLYSFSRKAICMGRIIQKGKLRKKDRDNLKEENYEDLYSGHQDRINDALGGDTPDELDKLEKRAITEAI